MSTKRVSAEKEEILIDTFFFRAANVVFRRAIPKSGDFCVFDFVEPVY
jgi:hypothetical protein